MGNTFTTNEVTVPTTNGPVFEYIPVLGIVAGTSVRIESITGLCTVHNNARSDRGRLHATLSFSGGVYTLTLYSDVTRSSGAAVLSGTVATLSTPFILSAQNNSGLTGRACVDSCTADDAGIVVLPTFAVDQDVLKNVDQCQLFQAYDPAFGFAYFHADAMRHILASDLPAAVPHLFGKTGLSAFVPLGVAALPDLRKIANVDQLRVAQAALVKALAAEDSEQSPAMQEIAKMARERYADAMQRLKDANIEEVEEAAQEKADELSVSVGTWKRG